MDLPQSLILRVSISDKSPDGAEADIAGQGPGRTTGLKKKNSVINMLHIRTHCQLNT